MNKTEVAAESIGGAEAKDEDTTTAVASSSRAPKAKQGKLIVRNLVFDLREKHLTSAFKKFGKILEVNVPVNPSTN